MRDAAWAGLRADGYSPDAARKPAPVDKDE